MNLPNSKDELLAYVEDQLNKMPKFYNIDPKNIDIAEIEKAMLTWNEVYERLVSLEVTAKMKASKSKENYDIFFNQKYLEITKRENTDEKKASKWLSSTEIERLVKIENTKEYLEYKEKMDIDDAVVAYMRRRLESWQSYNFILANVSKIESTKVNQVSPQDVFNNIGNGNSNLNSQLGNKNIFLG